MSSNITIKDADGACWITIAREKKANALLSDDCAAIGRYVEEAAAKTETKAIVFTGDFNLHASDPEDAPLLARLQKKDGLIDACEAVDCAAPDHIDKIFIRSSANVVLDARGWADNSADFLDSDSIDLSDHPPISASVGWTLLD